MKKENSVAMSEVLARMTLNERLEAHAREAENLFLLTAGDPWARDILNDIHAGDWGEAVIKATGNYDPTPWCNACGARLQSQCHCGPLADND
jgi:hypothetical protein